MRDEYDFSEGERNPYYEGLVMRVPKHNQNNFKIDWTGQHKDTILREVYELAKTTKLHTIGEHKAGVYVIRKHPELLKDAGWIGVGYMYNEVCRWMGFGSRGGKAPDRREEVRNIILQWVEEDKKKEVP